MNTQPSMSKHALLRCSIPAIRLFLLICLYCSGTGRAIARQKPDFSGRILNMQSAPVPGATLYLLNTNKAAITDESGYFIFKSIDVGTYTVQVSAIGYATLSAAVVLDGNQRVEWKLSLSATRLNTVLVSAQKKEELLQGIPVSVTALTSEAIRDYRLWNTGSLTAIAPNLYSANPGDQRNVTSIRGVTSTSYDPAVATYIDGVNQFGLDTYIAQLFDVERIEVLRGPQGTLYGRNAMGGVINIITRQPKDQVSGFAEINMGNFAQQRYSLGLRVPIVKGKLYAGIAGLYDSRKGYYTNEYTNSDFDRQHSTTLNYYLRYLPAANWNVVLNVKQHYNRNKGTFTLVNGAEEALAHPFVLNQNATTKMMDNTINSSLAVNYSGRKFRFASQTSYQSNHRYYTDPIDGDFSPIDGVTIINNYGNDWNKVSVWSQEFRLSSPATASRFGWTTGLYAFLQDNPVKQATHFGEDADLLGSPDKNFSILNTSRGKSSGMAVYGRLSYAVSKQLTIAAGLRYDYEHKKQDVLSEYLLDPDPDPVFTIIPDTGAVANFNAVSPSVQLMYDFNPAHSLFVSYNRGYRAGGLTQASSDPSQPPLYAYDPEYSNNLEAGTKNVFFNNRLRANVSLFYTTVNDAQVPTLVLPDAITVTRNAGKLESKGIEAEIEAMPVSGLQLQYAFGYTDAGYTNLKLSKDGTEVDLSGNRQLYTPDMTSMLAVQYRIPLSKRQSLDLIVRGEWQYIGEQYFDLANNIRQSPYQVLNARAGLQAKHVGLFFWMRNLADEKYIAYAYDFGAVHLGDPKTFGVTIRGRF